MCTIATINFSLYPPRVHKSPCGITDIASKHLPGRIWQDQKIKKLGHKKLEDKKSEKKYETSDIAAAKHLPGRIWQDRKIAKLGQILPF